jgi:hypothetical protein
VTSSDVVSQLLAACPSARSDWAAHCAEWEDEVPGNYLNVAVFARHIVKSFGRDQLGEFPGFFRLVETMICEGDEEVVSLATVGLIEDLQVLASHERFGAAVFLPWLLPRSLQAWAEIEEAWQGNRSLADVVRSEKRRVN